MRSAKFTPQIQDLGERTHQILLELATPDGILASSRQEKFGCVFGRDSAITVLGILRLLEKKTPSYIDQALLLDRSRIALLKLIDLQGRETNIESGEQPGKFIHEYREDNYERLVNRKKPWFVYSDGKLRNYDSIDSTPLTLIAIKRYWDKSGDSQFLLKALSAVEKGLDWIMTYGDADKDGLLEYDLPEKRTHGGLPVQSWTDSTESLMNKEGIFPKYPIAPVEVQGYAWLALKIWSDFFLNSDIKFPKEGVGWRRLGQKLNSQAELIKKRFNEAFIFEDEGLTFAAQALDGDKNQIKTVTGNPLLLLWATYEKGGKKETIIDHKYLDDFVKRGFLPDMFEADAGIRTMSAKSATFNPGEDSYHNGSFWPKLNGMIFQGLEIWGYKEESEKLKKATLAPIYYFQTPIELYVKNGKNFTPYKTSWGTMSCMQQAWSTTTVLDLLT